MALYSGRTPTATGLDQINFVVPATAPLGCQVAVTVLTSGSPSITSNSPTISLRPRMACALLRRDRRLIPTSALGKNSLLSGARGPETERHAQLQRKPQPRHYTRQRGILPVLRRPRFTSQFSSINSEPTLGTRLTGTVAERPRWQRPTRGNPPARRNFGYADSPPSGSAGSCSPRWRLGFTRKTP